MTTSFAKVLLDEDVDLIVADMLRAQGFVAQTTQGLGRKSKSDPEQLEFAAANGFLIVTHNRDDYAKLAVEWFEAGKSHSGIIAIAQVMPRELATRISRTLSKFSSTELKDQFLII
jgi:predicted nuclease of predicted toxin-antitoxin system